MNALAKRVFVLHAGQVRSVPTRIEDFDSLFDVIKLIVATKGLVEKTMKTVADYHRLKLNPKDPDAPHFVM
jgi:DNA-binding FrmR family transcriptional regulator